LFNGSKQNRIARYFISEQVGIYNLTNRRIGRSLLKLSELLLKPHFRESKRHFDHSSRPAQLQTRQNEQKALLSGSRARFSSISRFKDSLGLPWGSIVVVECEGGGTTGCILVGPPRFAPSRTGDGFWYLPVIELPERGVPEEALRRHGASWRKAHGLDLRESR
jgi:hypothetical protein